MGRGWNDDRLGGVRGVAAVSGSNGGGLKSEDVVGSCQSLEAPEAPIFGGVVRHA